MLSTPMYYTDYHNQVQQHLTVEFNFLQFTLTFILHRQQSYQLAWLPRIVSYSKSSNLVRFLYRTNMPIRFRSKTRVAIRIWSFVSDSGHYLPASLSAVLKCVNFTSPNEILDLVVTVHSSRSVCMYVTVNWSYPLVKHFIAYSVSSIITLSLS